MGKFSFLREARILNTNCVTSQNTSFLPMKDVFAPIDTGQSINGYNLTQKICETRMSVVFKAERKGDAVAIKFIKKRPEYAKQIEREISLLKDIDCPYIMHALDFFEYKDYTCFVMPLADQGSMHHNQKYPEDVVKRAIVSALKALREMQSMKWTNAVGSSTLPTPSTDVQRFYDQSLAEFLSGAKELTPENWAAFIEQFNRIGGEAWNASGVEAMEANGLVRE